MLVFKKNIYRHRKEPDSGPRLPEAIFDPCEFVSNSLKEELEVLQFIEKQPREYRRDDLHTFYPSAHKCMSWLTTLQMIRILSQGLECQKTWYRMNTYHFCVLYDVLKRNAFNYNHDIPDEQLRFLPSLQGGQLDFGQFVQDYFFNRVFLLDPDKFNNMSQSEKDRLGFTCPCQFGVINGLLPNADEMKLEESQDYPYTLYV